MDPDIAIALVSDVHLAGVPPEPIVVGYFGPLISASVGQGKKCFNQGAIRVGLRDPLGFAEWDSFLGGCCGICPTAESA
jgi:hypothetical protein